MAIIFENYPGFNVIEKPGDGICRPVFASLIFLGKTRLDPAPPVEHLHHVPHAFTSGAISRMVIPRGINSKENLLWSNTAKNFNQSCHQVWPVECNDQYWCDV